jgi:hypothetical protein
MLARCLIMALAISLAYSCSDAEKKTYLSSELKA